MPKIKEEEKQKVYSILLLCEPSQKKCVQSIDMEAETIQKYDHVLESWFHDLGWEPQLFQREVWHACWNRENGLLQAPTGSGKTLPPWRQ